MIIEYITDPASDVTTIIYCAVICSEYAERYNSHIRYKAWSWHRPYLERESFGTAVALIHFSKWCYKRVTVVLLILYAIRLRASVN